jgi:hypothetical protein
MLALYRNGNPLDRLMRRIIVSDSGCWEWQGYAQQGYGRLRVNGPKTLAHRFSFEVFVRPIPEGLTLDHLCRNPPCVNPSHLVPRTSVVNVLLGESLIAKRAASEYCRLGHSFQYEFFTNKGRRSFRRFCIICRNATARALANKSYSQRRALGLCVLCGNEGFQGGVFCATHREKANAPRRKGARFHA